MLCLALALVGGACTPGPLGEEGSPATGSVRLALEIQPGVTVSTADYRITGPGSLVVKGTVDVGDSADVSVPIPGLPPGMGYDVQVQAWASDDMTLCRGESAFIIVDSAPSMVLVHLDCQKPPQGDLMVQGSFRVCPVLEGIGASPGEVLVGASLSLSATVRVPDDRLGPPAFKWQSTSGSLTGGSWADQIFTCTAAGPATVRVTTSDANKDPECEEAMQLTVGCTAP
jgi:hypothetical protein